MKRIKPDISPDDREKAIEALTEDVQMLMMAAALIHHHRTGRIPFPPERALKAFSEIGDAVQQHDELKEKPHALKVANVIANSLMRRICDKECKGLTIPLSTFVSLMVFIPGGNISKLPCSGIIPVKMEDGEEFELCIDIDEAGKGGIYRYHDPESDSVRIGREYLLRIDPFDNL